MAKTTRAKKTVSQAEALAAVRTLSAFLAGEASAADAKRAQSALNAFQRQADRENNEKARDLGFRSAAEVTAKIVSGARRRG